MASKFKVNDRVRMVNVLHLTGLTGTILGVSSRAGANEFMIILLDEPLQSGQRAVTLIDSCIELLDREISREEAMQIYCNWIEEKNIRYEEALRLCISRAGIPDPLEACRLIIKTAEEALDHEKQVNKME